MKHVGFWFRLVSQKPKCAEGNSLGRNPKLKKKKKKSKNAFDATQKTDAQIVSIHCIKTKRTQPRLTHTSSHTRRPACTRQHTDGRNAHATNSRRVCEWQQTHSHTMQLCVSRTKTDTKVEHFMCWGMDNFNGVCSKTESLHRMQCIHRALPLLSLLALSYFY